ncbi:hypothetical protein Fot_13828 [Forsythia ovata]|uniref:Uncharacterized protein n=1 Tax=Forsythia ovata TaxID=205694 RepID=A0ABD1W839_9LAMI
MELIFTDRDTTTYKYPAETANYIDGGQQLSTLMAGNDFQEILRFLPEADDPRSVNSRDIHEYPERHFGNREIGSVGVWFATNSVNSLDKHPMRIQKSKKNLAAMEYSS